MRYRYALSTISGGHSQELCCYWLICGGCVPLQDRYNSHQTALVRAQALMMTPTKEIHQVFFFAFFKVRPPLFV